jgi:ABC-2 type transport system permease protein
MFRSVFLKSLRDQQRSLVGWSLGLGLLVALLAALWPSVRDIPDLAQFLANYPEAMRELFNIEAITTGAGFMNAELFSIILPALFIIFGIGRGARLIAGEEEAGTLEPIMVTPVPRARLLLEKAAALAVAVVALGIALFLVTVAAAAAADMGIGVGDAAVAALALALLGLEHGWLALAVGAASGRRSLAIAAAAAVAVAGYLLYVMGALVDELEPLKPISPFTQALESGPLGGAVPAAYAWMAVAAVAFLMMALPIFDRRDLAMR